MKVIVVPSNTPFLIANSVFRSLGAANDTDANQIFFQKAGPINPNCADRAEAVSPRHDGSLDSPTNCPKNAEIRMCRSQFWSVCNCFSDHQRKQTGQSVWPPGVFPNNVNAEQSRLNPQVPQFNIAPLELADSAEHVIQRLVRSVGRSPSPFGTAESGQLRSRRTSDGDESGRTERMPHWIRESSPEQILRENAGREEVHGMVCGELPPQPKDMPHEVPPLNRAPPGSCGGPDESSPLQGKGQSQGPQPGHPLCQGSPRCASRSTAPQLRRGGDRRLSLGTSDAPTRRWTTWTSAWRRWSPRCSRSWCIWTAMPCDLPTPDEQAPDRRSLWSLADSCWAVTSFWSNVGKKH